jgi:citrate synthase
MLDEIGGEAGIQPWMDRHLGDGERLMGFGHRIYRRRDPRADVLKAALTRFGARDDNRVALAEAVENTARETLARRYPGRGLDTNVEFYTALLLEAVGIDRRFFTPLFAAGRVLGWTAHAREQIATGRLMRPLSSYVCPLPEGENVALAAAGYCLYNAPPENGRMKKESLDFLEALPIFLGLARRGTPYSAATAASERPFTRAT